MDGSEAAIPGLKQILGALIFGAKKPLTARELRKNIEEVAENLGGLFAPYASLKDKDVREALEALAADTARSSIGFTLVEGPDGFLFQSEAACGPWLRHLLDMGRGQRLSRPALETLAIIAYKQPIIRADIEIVRGVSVDHILKTLMEAQLVRIMGRSDLPGRPLLYGTTHLFLEHFGLKDVTELPKLDELSRLETVRRARAAEAAAPVPTEEPPAPAEEVPSPLEEPAPVEEPPAPLSEPQPPAEAPESP
ncbi:MAG: SMC-Scp complex subunit ScpB [Kiritimatiellia bacterium]